jgi:HD-like signal output (HDOD) protein
VLPGFTHVPSPADLVRQLHDLPATPKVLQSLQRLLTDDTTTLVDLADLILLEPGLSGRVVRVANGMAFGRGRKVSSTVEAMQRVGMSGVHELVTFAVASQLVGRPLEAYGLDAQTLWLRAVACGIAAASLAEHVGVDKEAAYTAGLMHGVGLVVLDRLAAKASPALRFASSGYPLDFAPAERSAVGFSHAEAGAALLEFWGFSDAVVDAVRFQLEPEEATGPSRALCMVLATARWARTLFCVPDEVLPEIPTESWLTGAGVPVGEFGPWLDGIRRGFDQARHKLRLVV